MKRIGISHEEYDSLVRRLTAYRAAGVRLTAAGRSASPEDLAYLSTVRYPGCYMCDFIPDSAGRLREIRFDRVRPASDPRKK